MYVKTPEPPRHCCAPDLPCLAMDQARKMSLAVFESSVAPSSFCVFKELRFSRSAYKTTRTSPSRSPFRSTSWQSVVYQAAACPSNTLFVLQENLPAFLEHHMAMASVTGVQRALSMLREEETCARPSKQSFANSEAEKIISYARVASWTLDIADVDGGL